MSQDAIFQLGNWPRFLLFPVAAVGGYLAVLTPLAEQQAWMVVGWVIVLSYCWFCMAGSFHEAAHGSLFRTKWLNEMYGQLVGIFVMIPFSVFRATHRMHHAYLNTPQDYELWPYCDPSKSLSFRRAFVWLDVFLGVITAPIIYGRIYFRGSARLTVSERRWIPWEYAAVNLFWGSLVAGVVLAVEWGLYQPAWFHLCYLLPLLISPMINTLRKFVEHLGMDSIDQVQGTRTIAGKNWWTSLTSYFLFDISVHGPHHRYPKVRGEHLKQKLQDMQEQHPDRPIPVFPTYWAAIRDTLPALWHNPAVGTSTWPPADQANSSGNPHAPHHHAA